MLVTASWLNVSPCAAAPGNVAQTLSLEGSSTDPRDEGSLRVRELDQLAARFWAWRARQQPRSRDDITRLDRGPGWLPDVDPAADDRRAEQLAAFQAELGRIRPPADAVPDRVDHRPLRSALARVRWETAILRVRSIPRYWTDQALGPVFDA